ncbi:MAG: hypothetical protein A2X81_19630 [Desulfobacterales bacterium GWB2_56_26]|nr:MAG: hypothetical protein A2X81_19630 [Desulfobacterales bacterium GWB2_56_26]
MKIFLSDPERADRSSLKVKGRLMPYEDFTARLKNFCLSLGFREVNIRHLASCGDPENASDILANNPKDDAVVILSCRVSYNPNWGGYCGLPQLLVREKYDDRGEQCPSSFIAPFVRQYLFAKEHIYLTKTEEGRCLITIPENLLKIHGATRGSRLLVALDKVAEADEDGRIVPVATNGGTISFALANSLRQSLDARNFTWMPGRSIPIDRYLSRELFSFCEIDQAVDRNSRFWPTLLPHLGQIVTHRTPNLRAAELHLRHEFARAMATFIADHRPSLGNVLCLAGLDIDMAAFAGHEEHYFVPWKAYLERPGEEPGVEHALDQDDLFVRLMQQDKQCPA